VPYRDPDAQREYQRKWMANRRAAALEGKTCAVCGTADGPFDFHHVDPAEKLDHKVWSWTAAKREAELAKCLVLCRDCHIEHHRVLPLRCKRGHHFTAANTYVKPSTGRRECRTCKADRAKQAA
jgi:hypothetical protein